MQPWSWIITVIVIISIILLLVYFKQIELFTSSYNLGVCSKNCCSTQWPIPIDVTEDSGISIKDAQKYLTSNITCNNGVTNTGCVCLTEQTKNMFEKGGYVKDLPTDNKGLLLADNSISAFKIIEDQTPRPVNVIGQTTELTGSKSDTIVGKDEHIDRYRYVNDEIDISTQFSMPVNSNIITFDNEKINDAQKKNITQPNELTDVDKLVGRPIGQPDTN